MGKTKKARSRANLDPLSTQRRPDLVKAIEEASIITEVSQRKKKERTKQEEIDFVDDKLTKKILLSARQQQDELEGLKNSCVETRSQLTTKLGNSAGEVSSDEEESNDWPALGEDEEQGQLEHVEELNIDDADETILQTFMNPNPPTRRTLADIIMDKLTEKKTDVSTLVPDVEKHLPNMDQRVVEVYKDVKTILQKYRSGKLPKAFKVIPHLRNWEEILYVTEPDTWSAAAMYQATRIFVSNMNVHMTQRFLFLVLLPRIRDDIQYFKRLNFHLFMALKKALFKPAAFFKGILLPLCEEGTCTLREATIIGSVMSKCSIPVLHASAAMLKIAEMNYSGANSIFLRILISKKYALPFRVIDALVFHFLSFRSEHRPLPVLWHQSFLIFAETYRSDISSEQRESLLELLRHRTHILISPEIRKQLQNAECRDVEMDEPLLMPT